MTDAQNPGGWPDPQRPGYPQNPERDGAHVLDAAPGHDGQRVRFVALWAYGRWHPGERDVLASEASDWGWRYVAPCLTPSEVAAREEAARRDEREACAADVDCGCAARPDVLARLAEAGERKARNLCSHGDVCCALQAAAIRARGDAIPGEYQSEAEQERDELFNRLGRVTEELGLSMDVTASRIIEVIRMRVDDEREACASLSVRVEVPPGAETWSPLEAWEEALTLFDEAFRAAIRARGDATKDAGRLNDCGGSDSCCQGPCKAKY
jgi:hypothetical protein